MKKCNQRKYFSLVELMVVVVILGILAGLAGVAVIGRVDEANIEKAHSDIMTFEKAAKLFKLDTNKYPAALEDLITKPDSAKGWKGPYLERAISPDPWHNAFIYVVNHEDRTKPIVIRSMGPDGIEGNGDDITNYESEDGGGNDSGTGVISLDNAPVK